MQSWGYCPHVSAELLVDASVALRHDFVGVVDEAAADAGRPGPHAPAARSPAVHAVAIEGSFRVIFVGLGKDDVLGLAVEAVMLFLHGVALYINLGH